MKQKIVIKVAMDCEKCRKKVLKIAAMAQGAISVAVEGEDKVVVTGEVDSVCLANCLRKKVGHANIQSVEEVKEEKKKEDEKKKEESKPKELPLYYCPPTWFMMNPPSYVVYDEYPNNYCTIL